MCRALLLATTIVYCATVISAITSAPSVTSCHDQDVNPYIHFATKTAYRVNQNKDESKIQFDGILFLFAFIMLLLECCLQSPLYV